MMQYFITVKFLKHLTWIFLDIMPGSLASNAWFCRLRQKNPMLQVDNTTNTQALLQLQLVYTVGATYMYMHIDYKHTPSICKDNIWF